MKMDQENIAGLIVVAFLIILISIVFGGIAWDKQQTRLMYSNAYAKNQECRIHSQKTGYTQNVEKICGPIPQFGDYQK